MENLENHTRKQLEFLKIATQSCVDLVTTTINFKRSELDSAERRRDGYSNQIYAINEQLCKLSEKPLKDQVKDIHNAHLNKLQDGK